MFREETHKKVISNGMKTYDLIIIGSGGGTKLRPAADRGHKVAIIEKDALGGTCLNRGCIPSKMLIYPADLITHWQEDRAKFGITGGGDFTIDFTALTTRTTETVQKDSQGIAAMYQKHPQVDYYHGQAQFVSGKVIEVNGEQLTADKIFVATGARPSIPPIPGLLGTPFFTSTEALQSENQPKTMIVIGGGYIAMELGHFYAATGTKVTFLVRGEFVGAEDKDIRAAFTENFSKRHSIVRIDAINEVSYQENSTEKEFTVSITNKQGEVEILKAESLFVATGVQPNSDTLALQNTAIKTNDKGFIEVNEYLETGEPGVFAFGDVVGKFLFRHSVNFEGEYLYSQHYSDDGEMLMPGPIVYPPMPHAIFSYPQIAGVGVTEDELEKAGKVLGQDYVVGMNEYKNTAMGMAMLPKVGLVKLIAEKDTGRIIGAHIVGDKASDLIHMLIASMTMKATAGDLLKMIYIHPALSEAIRNAARKLAKQVLP
jgi:dihydrolipoamide dehydrogenase